GSVREPIEPPCDWGTHVDIGRVLEGEERHRRHRILVNGIDGVPFDELPGSVVVVPPPLPGGPLTGAEGRGAAQSDVAGRRVARYLGVPSKSVDRVHEIGEAADVPAKRSGPAAEVMRKRRRAGLERRDQAAGEPRAKGPGQLVRFGA